MVKIRILVSVFLGLWIGGIAVVAAADMNASTLDAKQRPLTHEEMLLRITSIAPQAVEGMTVARFAKRMNALNEHRKAARGIGVSCSIIDGDIGSDDGTIDEWNGGDIADWFFYDSGGNVATQVSFLLVPLFTGSTLDFVYQRFSLAGGSATNITTPAGVPFWGGGLTQGRWLLLVFTDTGLNNFCLTSVTP